MVYKSKINKKIIIIIQLLIICIILSCGVILKTYASQLLEKNVDFNGTQVNHIETKIEYMGVTEVISADINTSLNDDIIKNISKIKIRFRNKNIYISGKTPLSLIYPQYSGKDKAELVYVFDKKGNFIKGEVKENTALEESLRELIIENINNSNNNITKEEVEKNINIESNNSVQHNNEITEEKEVNDNLATRIADSSDILSTENYLDKNLQQVKIKGKEYILGTSIFKTKLENNETKTIHEDGIDYICKSINNTPILIGVAGKLEEINYNDAQNEEDLITILGTPLKVNNMLYWQYENQLFISYNNEKIEILFKK